MAAIIGFAGSFISLAMSKTMAKRAMRVQIIERPRSEAERWLLAVVRRQAEAAGIGMPEVGIFESPTMNAFATGMNRDDALLSLERYATSKIFTDDDLFAINTLGFRGEALPSIAAVSSKRTTNSDGSLPW